VSVTVETSQVTYNGNGFDTEFFTLFPFLESDDLTVEQRTGTGNWSTKTEGVDYAVDGAGEDEGGIVTFTVAPPNGDSVRITRNTNITQTADFQPQGPFPVARHEDALDKLTLIAQDIERRVDVLEAGAVEVTLAAAQITDTFTAAEPIEDTFPRVVSCTGTPASVILTRIENLSTPGEVLPAEGLLWDTPAAGSFTVQHLEGLTPGQQYRVRYLVLT